MTATHEPANRDDLREYLWVVRSRKWEIALIAVVVLGATIAFTLRQTPIYEATAEVLVQPIQNPLSVVAPAAPDMNTEQQLLTSQAVAGEVLRNSTIPVPLSQLTGNLSVDVVADTEVLQVHYSSPSPTIAANLANAFANAYIQFRTQQAVDRLQATADTIKHQIDGVKKQYKRLNRQIAGNTDPSLLDALTTQRTSLIGRLGVLQSEYSTLQPDGVQSSGSVVVQRATRPTSPASPNKARNGALALLAGLALGVGFAFLRERLDDRIKSREELERRLGAPVLAIVPKVLAWKHEEDARLIMQIEPRSPVAESYRTLSTNLQYIASRQKLKVMMITSSAGDEGKTTTAANLAVALAQAGKLVIVVSADMRKPRLHRFFELPNTVGLSDLLAGTAKLSDVALQTGVPGLRVITGGPIPQNPAALLGGEHAARVLDEMREVADFVILDAPPTLAVADASVLAPLADGTLFLLDAGRAGRSIVQQARGQLQNAGAEIIGAIFNKFDRSKSGAYQYTYYTYYYEYLDIEGEASKSSRSGGRRKRSSRSASRGSKPNDGEFGFHAEGQSAAAGVAAAANPTRAANSKPEPESPAQKSTGKKAGREPPADGFGLNDLFEPMWDRDPRTPAERARGGADSREPASKGRTSAEPVVKLPSEEDEGSSVGGPEHPRNN